MMHHSIPMEICVLTSCIDEGGGLARPFEDTMFGYVKGNLEGTREGGPPTTTAVALKTQIPNFFYLKFAFDRLSSLIKNLSQSD